MKYYKTGSYNELIKEVEVSRETDKSLYIVFIKRKKVNLNVMVRNITANSDIY